MRLGREKRRLPASARTSLFFRSQCPRPQPDPPVGLYCKLLWKIQGSRTGASGAAQGDRRTGELPRQHSVIPGAWPISIYRLIAGLVACATLVAVLPLAAAVPTPKS